MPSRPYEGRFAIVTIRGAGCGGRKGAQTMRVRCVRSSRVVLIPRRWDQVNRDDRLAMVAKKPGHQGERGAAVKPLRRECRDVSAHLY